MQSLNDFFPEDFKEQRAASNLKPGSILKFHVTFTTPSKVKMMIIVAIDGDKISFASVLINSEINPNLFKTAILRDLHIEIDPDGKDYLDHISYIDCSKVFEQDINIVKENLKENPAFHAGELDEAIFEIVLDKVRNAHTISEKVKRKYGLTK